MVVLTSSWFTSDKACALWTIPICSWTTVIAEIFSWRNAFRTTPVVSGRTTWCLFRIAHTTISNPNISWLAISWSRMRHTRGTIPVFSAATSWNCGFGWNTAGSIPSVSWITRERVPIILLILMILLILLLIFPFVLLVLPLIFPLCLLVIPLILLILPLISLVCSPIPSSTKTSWSPLISEATETECGVGNYNNKKKGY